MFGRRRRPILGAAVVYGASRAAAKHESAATMIPPQPRYDEAYPMMQAQTRDLGVFNPINDGNTTIQPAPAYQVGPQRGPVQGPVPGSRIHYCTQCGFGCQETDRFCRQCGAKQAAGEIVVG
ncbi:hypothetical protein ACJA88_014649 [Fusarium oxysporum]